eukprot:scaffold4958_cov406-Prasinococcus_capsulatus_cf.AAC.12
MVPGGTLADRLRSPSPQTPPHLHGTWCVPTLNARLAREHPHGTAMCFESYWDSRTGKLTPGQTGGQRHLSHDLACSRLRVLQAQPQGISRSARLPTLALSWGSGQTAGTEHRRPVPACSSPETQALLPQSGANEHPVVRRTAAARLAAPPRTAELSTKGSSPNSWRHRAALTQRAPAAATTATIRFNSLTKLASKTVPAHL